MINIDTRKIIYIDQWINTGKDNSLTLDNTNLKAYKDDIGIAVSNILRCKYRSTLTTNMLEAELNESWFYKPKQVAYQLYRCIDFFWVLLWMNNMTSINEFNQSKIRIYDPTKWSLINAIIDKEKDYISSIIQNPQKAISTKRTYRRD